MEINKLEQIEQSINNLNQTVENLKSLVEYIVRTAPYYGSNKYCPICDKSSSQFRQFGITPRQFAQCPHYHSLERHRLSWWFFLKRTNIFSGVAHKILHVAPEGCFAPRLHARFGSNYTSADISGQNVSVKMDITDIEFPANHFDIIYCSHVLEHVVDDHKAMTEFYRVLNPGGWAILLVPIMAEKTFEDFSITTPQERLKAFGQSDHVRSYGYDYYDRLVSAGFDVEVIRIHDLMSQEEALYMGITVDAGDIYYCTKVK